METTACFCLGARLGPARRHHCTYPSLHQLQVTLATHSSISSSGKAEEPYIYNLLHKTKTTRSRTFRVIVHAGTGTGYGAVITTSTSVHVRCMCTGVRVCARVNYWAHMSSSPSSPFASSTARHTCELHLRSLPWSRRNDVHPPAEALRHKPRVVFVHCSSALFIPASSRAARSPCRAQRWS